MRKLSISLLAVVALVALGFLLPEPFTLPVQGATRNSFDQRSFWYYPWGKSVTHKDVDVIARRGTAVMSAVPGIVVYTGQLNMGGNVVLVLGPRWRRLLCAFGQHRHEHRRMAIAR